MIDLKLILSSFLLVASIMATGSVLAIDNSFSSKPDTPALNVDINYLDQSADLSSPHHSLNTGLDHEINNSSREFRTSMDYRFDYLTPKAAFKFSPNSYGAGQYYNYELGVAIPIKDVLSLETRYGWNKFDKKVDEGGMEDYQDWSIGVSTNYKGMKLKVDYIDVNASQNSEACGQSFPCESKTVFSIIKNF